ncbi:MAG: aminodeoxychorismate/anthranilate synthase component II [bacterium]|nr:aminodeoxychorismate/anthranilate synthase component II [bacterium]
MAKITLIDNYDSFTYNLVHYLGELGSEVTVYRNDAKTVREILAHKPAALILSPGPCEPDQAGITLDLIKEAPRDLPILGVCLGHQSIGQAFGGKVVRAPKLMHGKLSHIHHQGEGIFKDLPTPFEATRYHSLIVERDSLPDCLHVTARTSDGLIMAFEHVEHPIHGVQFHPESIASQHGHKMLANFLKLAAIKCKTPKNFSFNRPAIAVV